METSCYIQFYYAFAHIRVCIVEANILKPKAYLMVSNSLTLES